MKETMSFHIAALYREFLAYTTEELKKLGLSFGQMPFIIYVGKHPGCTQAEMTRNLKLDWGYSQRSVTKLVNSGFIEKEFDDKKAGNCLELTALGSRAFDVSHKVFNSWDELKTGGLSPEEKTTLVNLLSKISG